MEDQFIDTSSGKLFVKIRRAPNPKDQHRCFLFWPSLFTDHTVYLKIAEEIGQSDKNAFLILVDPPGHGQSTFSKKFSMADSAVAVTEILDALEEKKCILIGTSWGGLAAIQLARYHPTYIEAMIISNPPMKPYSGIDKMKYQTVLNLYKIFGAAKFIVRKNVDALLGSQTVKAHPELKTQLVASILDFKSHSDMVKAAECVLLEREDVSKSLASIQVPSLFVAGSADHIAPAKQIKELVDGIDMIEFLMMENSGHVIPVDQPERLLEEIHRFLAKL